MKNLHGKTVITVEIGGGQGHIGPPNVQGRGGLNNDRPNVIRLALTPPCNAVT